jgi:cytochrome P450
LTPKAVANFTDEFGSTVQRLIAQARQYGEIDFIKNFAKPAMTSFWGANLGLSSDEVGEAMRLASDLIHAFSLAPTEDQLQLAYQAAQGWLETMPKLIARAERKGSFPIVDGLSAAFEAIDADHRVADQYFLLSSGLFDGFHTLGSGFAATVYGMLESGLQPVAHRASPGTLAKGLVSEAFRIHGAVAMTTREALADFEYDGVQIPRGTNIYMIWSCANLDPDVFEDPFSYVLDRKNAARKLSFGGGPYMCAGRHLVGLLSERLVTEFVEAGVEVSPAGTCKWRTGSTIHELTEFPIILN